MVAAAIRPEGHLGLDDESPVPIRGQPMWDGIPFEDCPNGRRARLIPIAASLGVFTAEVNRSYGQILY